MAVQGKYAELVEVATHGAQVDLREEHGSTPLQTAAKYGNLETATMLLAHGAKPAPSDNDGETPLLYALMWGTRTWSRCCAGTNRTAHGKRACSMPTWRGAKGAMARPSIRV